MAFCCGVWEWAGNRGPDPIFSEALKCKKFDKELLLKQVYWMPGDLLLLVNVIDIENRVTD
jgi:hypothetical protein